MPRAKPYSEGEAPTHLGDAPSPWEEEASTTVEQGEVAEKVRTLGFAKQGHNTGHTHTGTGVDEPTVDDQHAHGVLSAVTPIRADNVARLIITAGNDAGQEIEIRPGKSYTIGRGLDNDIVLTDIAVSRKHFDLKFEDGAWIIVDRGSGNGTVVNGNLEDNPFMLASGDTIEIGNTIFRYDHPNGSPRAEQGNFDDDEMSTVAGKPLRNEQVHEDPPPAPLPRERPRPERPKTLPPPVPLRAQMPSAPPPLSFAPPAPLPPQPMPASTLPMPQMANRPPLNMGHNSPTMMGDAMGMPLPPAPQHLLHNGMPMGPNGAPSTLPGHAQPQHRPSPSYPYPQAQEIPPHSVHAQMLLIQTQNRRSDGSTAHVPPAHYDPSMYGMAPPQYGVPPRAGISKRTKLAIAGIGLALLTGIVTAAVVKSGSSSKKPAISASDKKDAKKADAKDAKKADAKDAKASKPTVEPIVDAPKVADVPKQVVQDTKALKAAEEKAAQDKAAQDKAAQEKAAQDAKAAKVAEEKAAKDAKAAKAAEDRAAAQEAKRLAAQKRTTTKREARRETPVRETPPKRTAVAADSSAARDKADALYRQKKFADAANILAKAAASASDDEAAELRDRSSKMSLLGKSYARGMAPGEKAIPAYTELSKAYNFDGTFGGNFRDEIMAKLGTVAPKAAIAFASQENYGKAREAYLQAQRAGSTDGNLQIVKGKLESYAKELYALAQKEASSNPGPAKEKLKQIRTLVDANSKIARDAQALYNKL